jgi:hypothetical protein
MGRQSPHISGLAAVGSLVTLFGICSIGLDFYTADKSYYESHRGDPPYVLGIIALLIGFGMLALDAKGNKRRR